jgi:voltage-gated potassium channel Kch
MRLAASSGSRDLLMAIAMFLAIGTALLTAAVGLSAALGAFLAGMLLSESEYRHQLEVDIEPFKGLLLGFFFLTVGMSLDIFTLDIGVPGLLIALAGLIVVKVITVYAAARIFRIDPPVAIEAAFILAGAGEFAFIIFTLASGEGILHDAGRESAVAVAVLSMLAVPILAHIGQRLAGRLGQRSNVKSHGVTDELGDTKEHVILGGFGRVGETVAQVLEAEEIRYIALDIDGDLVAEKRARGLSVYFGDATRKEILERVGGDQALSFLVTTDEAGAADRMVRAIRKAWPDVPIHARAIDTDHARRLHDAGATDAVPEALEGSLQLAGRVLAGIGLPDAAIDARLDEVRHSEIKNRRTVREEESNARANHRNNADGKPDVSKSTTASGQS